MFVAIKKHILLCQGGSVVTHVPLWISLVGLSAELHKNYWTYFHKTWMEEGSHPPEWTTFTFSVGLDKGTDAGLFFSPLTLWDRVPRGINAWVLMAVICERVKKPGFKCVFNRGVIFLRCFISVFNMATTSSNAQLRWFGIQKDTNKLI